MNTKLLSSKKFRTAVITAVVSLTTFISSKFGLHLDKEELQTLLTVISVPFAMYILAEAVSEAGAKKSIVENQAREDLANKVLKEIIEDSNEKVNDTNSGPGAR